MGLHLVLAALAAFQSPPTFHAVVLESEGHTSPVVSDLAVAINEAGECVGTVVGFDGTYHAAHWSQAGVLTDLGGPWAMAVDVNDEGLAIGWSELNPDTYPIVWDLGVGSMALSFPAASWGVGVDAHSGLLVGTANTSAYHATFLERDGTAHTIPSVTALALNGVRQVAGLRSVPGGPVRAFRWSASTGALELLDPPAGFVNSFGFGLDDAGTVVGYARMADGQDRAMLWTTSNVPMPLPPTREDVISSNAYAIGPQGWIVGAEALDETYAFAAYAVLWVGGKGYKIDNLLVSSTRVHVVAAWDVNGAGQIVGRAIVRGVGRAVRLDPVAGR